MVRKRKRNKKKGIRPPKKPKSALVCPNCLRLKKGIKIDNYILCVYCGLVVYKPAGSLEQIKAPGFIPMPADKELKQADKKKAEHIT